MIPGMPPGFQAALQQAQALAERMRKAREEVGRRTVESSVGGGMVKAVADGAGRLRAIHIEPEVVAEGDLEMLQDLVVAAANQALAEAKRMADEALRQETGGLPLAGLEGLLGGLSGLFGGEPER
jgi:hypothetical protein